MNNKIHPTAIISDGAKLGNNVEIGAYCVIGKNVCLGDNIKLHSHVCVDGYTSIGDGTCIFPFASIGHIPQDLKYAGEKTKLVIGKNNTIREHVTINPGTAGDNSITTIGDNCLFMMSTHVAHDCVVGNHVILANNATLAGHVKVGDNVVIGGLSAVHQFVRIGHNAMIGGMSGIENDIIPYGQASGERAFLVGLNLVGLKRKNTSRSDIQALRKCYKALFLREGTLQQRIENAANEFKGIEQAQELVEFITNNGARAICQPKSS